MLRINAKDLLGKIVPLGVASLIGGLTAAVALAAIPDTNGGIHGCYRNSAGLTGQKGALRTIDSEAGQTCTAQETALTWSQDGSRNGILRKDTFTNTNLEFLTLTYWDLRGVNFSGSQFPDSGINVAGSDLRGANLSSSTGNIVNANANFSGANLKNAIITSLRGGKGNFENVDWSGGVLGQIIGTGNKFHIVNFSNATINGLGQEGGNSFTGSTFTNTEITGTVDLNDFSGADFRTAVLDNASMTNNNLSNTNFSVKTIGPAVISGPDTLLNQANFTGSALNGTRIIGVGTQPQTINFTNAVFNGATFLGTDLSAATLTGAIWNETECPDGSLSQNNGNTCIGHLTP